MKNTFKLFGIIALAAVIGFGVAGCEHPTDSPPPTVITPTTGKTLTSITLNTASVKKAYIQDETLNLSGLVVTAAYSDGSSAAVTNYTASPANGAALSTPGTTTVTVSYTEGAVTKTAGFSVTVTAKTLTGITANYTGTTHVYTFTLLDSLKDHLTVTAQYNNNTSATLEAEDYTLTGALTAGTSTITASYTEGGVTKTATFDVTVTAATLDSIVVAFDQDDETIYESTPLDNLKQYLAVTATYTFTGSQETYEETLSAHEYTLSGELTAGTPTITVNYGGKTYDFTPTVTAVVLTSITATYTGGDVEINSNVDSLKTALTVTAHYNDGNTPTVSEYTLSSDSLFTAIGSKTITVTYKGETATFNVTVVCTHNWNTETGLCGNDCGELYYSLGDTGPGGGKIFYVSATGFTMTDDNTTAHYLEAAPADMETTLTWASSGFSTDIADTEEAIGTGRKNTALILAIDVNAPAAKACDDYNNGGKTDWFLPSIDELNQLYVNKTSVNMGVESYWSSSETLSGFAWMQYFSDGNPGYYGNKSNTLSVRAVRAF